MEERKYNKDISMFSEEKGTVIGEYTDKIFSSGVGINILLKLKEF